MRNTVMVCALMWRVAFHAGVTPQSAPDPKPKVPDKGDIIVVKGCLSGTTLEDTASGRTYHLKGEKALIQLLTKEHKGHMDEVTGELKSSLRAGSTRSKQVGKTRITIGAVETRNTGGTDEFNPVLEVKSFKHLLGLCAK